jgi:hypothetical protein
MRVTSEGRLQVYQVSGLTNSDDAPTIYTELYASGQAGNLSYQFPTTAAVGTQFLQNIAGVLSWATVSGSAHNLLSATHTDTLAASPPARGSIVKGNATPVWAEFARGTADQLLSVNSTPNDLEYRTLTPVANETTVAFGAGTITVGLVDPLIVGKGGTGLATLTDRAVLLGRGTAAIEFASPAAAGGVLRSTGAASNPAFGQVDLTDGDAVVNALPIGNGGTGQATATLGFNALDPLTTLGDTLFHNGTDSVRLAGNTTATAMFLRQTGTGAVSAAPVWAALTAANIPDFGKVLNSAGDTTADYNTSTNLAGANINFSTNNPGLDESITWAFTPQATVTGRFLRGDTGNPDSWQESAWTLPATVATNQALFATGATTVTAGTLPVDAGGTELATLTDRGVLIGRGTAPVEFATSAAIGSVLRGTAANPAFGQVDLADPDAVTGILPVGNFAAHALLSASHGDTALGTVARGDLIIGRTASPVWTRVPVGPLSGQFLRSDGTDADWSTLRMANSIVSGAILYGSATNIAASSALLDQNELVLGGGAGGAPATPIVGTGTTTQVLHGAAGAPTWAGVSKADTTGGLFVFTDQSNTYSTGTQNFGLARLTLPIQANPGSPLDGEIWLSTNGTPGSEVVKYRTKAASPNPANTKTLVVSEGLVGGQGISGGVYGTEHLDLYANSAFVVQRNALSAGDVRLHSVLTLPDSFEILADPSNPFFGLGTVALMQATGTISVLTGGAVPIVTGYSHAGVLQYNAAAFQALYASPAFQAVNNIRQTQGRIDALSGLWAGFLAQQTWGVSGAGQAGRGGQVSGYECELGTSFADGAVPSASVLNNSDCFGDSPISAQGLGAGRTNGMPLLNARTLRARNPLVSNGGTIQHVIGVDIENLTRGVRSNYGIRSRSPTLQSVIVGPLSSIKNVGGVSIEAAAQPPAPTVGLVTTSTTTTLSTSTTTSTYAGPSTSTTTTSTSTTTTSTTTTSTTTTSTTTSTTTTSLGSWGYKIVTITRSGSTQASAETVQSNGISNTLTTSRFNRITWPAQDGALQYKVYRTSACGTCTPSTINRLLCTVGVEGQDEAGQDTDDLFCNDTNVVGTSETPATENTTSNLLVNGSLQGKVVSGLAYPYTVRVNDMFVQVDTTGAARTIDLPAAAAAGAGKIYIIKDEDNNALINNITIDASGAETIDGALTKVINTTGFQAVRLYCTGAAWFTW